MKIQDRYVKLCLELGDLTLKQDRVNARIQEIKAEVAILDNLAALEKQNKAQQPEPKLETQK